VRAEGDDAVADQVRRRLEARGEQEDHVGDQLLVADRVAVVLDCDEPRQQVVLRVRPPDLDEAVEVLGHLAERGRRRHHRLGVDVQLE
jgi:hypothetical protein